MITFIVYTYRAHIRRKWTCFKGDGHVPIKILIATIDNILIISRVPPGCEEGGEPPSADGGGAGRLLGTAVQAHCGELVVPPTGYTYIYMTWNFSWLNC